MARRKKITEGELKSVISGHLNNALGFDGGNLSRAREKSLEYYLSEKMGNEVEGRSQIVSSDVSDAVEPLMANLMRIFTSSNQLFLCEPVGAEDVDIAEQATAYINHIMFKKNNGWVLLHNFIKDALIEKNGFLKIYWEQTDRVEREEYTGLDQDQLNLLIDDDAVEVIEHTSYDDLTSSYEEEPNPMAQDMQEGQHKMPDGTMMSDSEMPPAPGDMPNQNPLDNGMGVSQFGIPNEEDPTVDSELLAEFENPTPQLHDCVIHRNFSKGKCRVEGIPPEEFIIEASAKNIDDANFVAHRRYMTRSQLLEAGHNKDIIDTLPTRTDRQNSMEVAARNNEISIDTGLGQSMDYATEEVEIFECYVKCNYEGDGKATLRKVTVVGNSASTVLDDEPVDSFPFVSMTPILMPHRFYGRSIAELVEDVQSTKTFIMRALNDNIFGMNNNRLIVNDSVTNLSDILTNRPNMVVRVKGSPSEAVQTMPVQPIGDTAYPLIKYYDELKEARTGVSKVSQGLDPNALNSRTASGVNSVLSQAQSRMEFFARTFANTGVADLGRKILEVVVKNQDKEDIVRVNEKFVPFKPYEWRDRCDLTIQSGLGSGSRDQQMVVLNNILERQIQALQLQGNPEAPIVNLKKIHTTLKRMVESAGLNDVGQFFIDPDEGQQQMPPEEPKEPTEFEKVSMAQIDGEMKRKQMDLELQEKKLELDHKKSLYDLELKAREMELKYSAQVDQEQIKRDTKMSTEAMKLKGALQKQAMATPQPPMPSDLPLPSQGIELPNKMPSANIQEMPSAPPMGMPKPPTNNEY
tara:strand:- start:196 stop:2607 length:2412 start_codon:yes stop_codon:yes gene_type:complete